MGINKMLRLLIILLLLCFNSANASEKDHRFFAAESAYSLNDLETAFKLFKELADEGDAESEYYLGTMYLMFEIPRAELIRLFEVKEDPINIGIKFIEKAAEKKQPDALGMLASFYERGFESFELNTSKAMRLREAAAETGDALGQYNLAVILLESEDQTDQAKAYKLFKSAAQKQLITAYFNLGVIHLRRSTNEDLIRAYAWFKKVVNWKPTGDVQGLLGQQKQVFQISSEILSELETALSEKQISEATRKSLNIEYDD